MKKDERMILILLSALNFTHILDFMIMMPLNLYLMPYFHISTKEFSVLVSAYTFSAALVGLLASLFVDRFDRKKVLLFGYIGFLVGTLACGLADSFYLLLVARIFAGLFGGLIAAQVLSIISDLFTYENRGKAVGAVMSAFAVASAIGVPFALVLTTHFGWRAPFLLIGGLGIVLIPFLMKYIPAMSSHILDKDKRKSPFVSIKNAILIPKIRLALLFSFLVTAGHFIVIPFINPYMVYNNKYSETAAPMIYLVGGLAAFAAALTLGRVSDIHGKLKVFTICMLLSLPLIVGITHLVGLAFWVMLVLFALWFITSTGRTVTAQAMITNTVPHHERGGFMSLNSSIQQLAISIASLVSGFVVVENADKTLQHYGVLGYISIGVLLFSLLLGKYLFNNMDKPTIEKVPTN
jgi:DHA1 family inner membrane transport protein